VPDDKVPDDKVPDDKVPDDKVPDDKVPDDKVPDDKPAADAPGVPGAEGEAGAAGEQGEKQAAPAEGGPDPLAKVDEEEAKAQAALEERRVIERENRLAQEAYGEKVKAGQKRVRELNSRFADWYYVVSEAEYAKIRLGRSGVIQAKPADEAPAGPAAEPVP